MGKTKSSSIKFVSQQLPSIELLVNDESSNDIEAIGAFGEVLSSVLDINREILVFRELKEDARLSDVLNSSVHIGLMNYLTINSKGELVSIEYKDPKSVEEVSGCVFSIKLRSRKPKNAYNRSAFDVLFSKGSSKPVLDISLLEYFDYPTIYFKVADESVQTGLEFTNFAQLYILYSKYAVSSLFQKESEYLISSKYYLDKIDSRNHKKRICSLDLSTAFEELRSEISDLNKMNNYRLPDFIDYFNCKVLLQIFDQSSLNYIYRLSKIPSKVINFEISVDRDSTNEFIYDEVERKFIFSSQSIMSDGIISSQRHTSQTSYLKTSFENSKFDTNCTPAINENSKYVSQSKIISEELSQPKIYDNNLFGVFKNLTPEFTRSFTESNTEKTERIDLKAITNLPEKVESQDSATQKIIENEKDPRDTTDDKIASTVNSEYLEADTVNHQSTKKNEESTIKKKESSEKENMIIEKKSIIGEEEGIIVGEEELIIGEKESIIGEKESIIEQKESIIVKREGIMEEQINPIVEQESIFRVHGSIFKEKANNIVEKETTGEDNVLAKTIHAVSEDMENDYTNYNRVYEANQESVPAVEKESNEKEVNHQSENFERSKTREIENIKASKNENKLLAHKNKDVVSNDKDGSVDLAKQLLMTRESVDTVINKNDTSDELQAFEENTSLNYSQVFNGNVKINPKKVSETKYREEEDSDSDFDLLEERSYDSSTNGTVFKNLSPKIKKNSKPEKELPDRNQYKSDTMDMGNSAFFTLTKSADLSSSAELAKKVSNDDLNDNSSTIMKNSKHKKEEGDIRKRKNHYSDRNLKNKQVKKENEIHESDRRTLLSSTTTNKTNKSLINKAHRKSKIAKDSKSLRKSKRRKSLDFELIEDSSTFPKKSSHEFSEDYVSLTFEKLSTNKSKKKESASRNPLAKKSLFESHSKDDSSSDVEFLGEEFSNESAIIPPKSGKNKNAEQSVHPKKHKKKTEEGTFSKTQMSRRHQNAMKPKNRASAERSLLLDDDLSADSKPLSSTELLNAIDLSEEEGEDYPKSSSLLQSTRLRKKIIRYGK